MSRREDAMSMGSAGRQPAYVILSGYHDYRSKRKADLHFIADELKTRGDVAFISLRYSALTRYREDPRHDLWDRANRLEDCNGVACYLWRTLVHPFRMPARLALMEKAAFAYYASRVPTEMASLIEKATVVLVESGVAITFIPLVKRLNPKVRIVYMASDALDAVGQASAIKQAFKAVARAIDGARVPSPYLAADIPPEIPCYYIPHGIAKDEFAAIGPSPFPPGSINAVSVGSMLFDASFFEIAGRSFPDIAFHVIGSGHSGPAPSNVRYYPEMPFTRTLPYLKHSTIAIAPYRRGVERYLTHTSMKLMQYNYLGIPAVCPETVAGEGLGRFGYRIGDESSIRLAIEGALRRPTAVASANHLTWGEITERLLCLREDKVERSDEIDEERLGGNQRRDLAS